MKQTKTAIELEYGTEILVLPKSPRLYLIDLELDERLCVKEHEAVIDEKSFRDRIADCYEYVAREHLEEQEHRRIYGDIDRNKIETFIEQDLKNKGNRFVLDKIFFYGYYRVKKDMLPFADPFYYCNDDIEQPDVV